MGVGIAVCRSGGGEYKPFETNELDIPNPFSVPPRRDTHRKKTNVQFETP